MINTCTFIGHLAADPEIRTVGDTKVANLTIGCNENWTDKAGQRQSKTEWVRLAAWRKLVDIVEKYAKKGQQVFVEGKMETRQYEKDGVKHYATEINLNTFKILGVKKEEQQPEPTRAAQRQPAPPPGMSGEEGADDLPF